MQHGPPLLYLPLAHRLWPVQFLQQESRKYLVISVSRLYEVNINDPIPSPAEALENLFEVTIPLFPASQTGKAPPDIFGSNNLARATQKS